MDGGQTHLAALDVALRAKDPDFVEIIRSALEGRGRRPTLEGECSTARAGTRFRPERGFGVGTKVEVSDWRGYRST
jgi:hypothetical protein